MDENWNMKSQAIFGDFAKISNFTGPKNFTIALSVFMVVDNKSEIQRFQVS